MAKVSIINVPAHGHINPTLAVVHELVERGEKATYYATEPFRQVIESTGARFRGYHGENLMPMGGSSTPGQPEDANRVYGFGDFLLYMVRTQIALVPELLDLLHSDMPDYVIFGNMCHAGRFAAEILERPAIASFASLIQFNTLVQDRAKTPQVSTAMEEAQNKYQQMQQELREIYKIELPEPFRLMQWPAALNIVYTSRDFQANSEQYDDSFVFVGPSIMQRPSPVAFPFELLDDRPLIYISLGTIFNDRPDFYRMCIEAFSDKAYQVVMVLPDKIDIGGIPANFIVEPYVPQLELFPRVAAFVTHGGMSSVQEALSFGVPLVVFPQMIEQTATARRVAELGLGVMLSSEELTADKLRTAVNHIMLNDTFRLKSKQMSESLKAAGGFQRAADVIQAYVQQSR